MKPRKILLVGKDSRLMAELEEALKKEGFNAKWWDDLDELNHVDATAYCMVFMGAGLPAAEKERYQPQWKQDNPSLLFVEGLASSIPLLVAQVQLAFSRQIDYEPYINSLSITNDTEPTAHFMVNADGYLEIKVFTPSLLSGFKEHTIAARHFEKGRYMLPLQKKYFSNKRHSYFMVREDNNVSCILDLNDTSVSRSYHAYC